MNQDFYNEAPICAGQGNFKASINRMLPSGQVFPGGRICFEFDPIKILVCCINRLFVTRLCRIDE